MATKSFIATQNYGKDGVITGILDACRIHVRIHHIQVCVRLLFSKCSKQNKLLVLRSPQWTITGK